MSSSLTNSTGLNCKRWPRNYFLGSASWVIPTAFSLIGHQTIHSLQSFSERSEKRIRLGVDMLLDRACVGGGWNSGNSVVYGVPLLPHVEATAIALLALQDEERTPVIRRAWPGSNRDPPPSSRWRVSPGASSACSCIKSRSTISRPDWRRSSETAATFGTMRLSPPRFWR
jgi:hypothetical protein